MSGRVERTSVDEFSVSAVIPVYNREAYIEEAVRSVLAQPETGEVIVVDDGSSDGSRAIVEKLAAEDERVVPLRHVDGGNHGISATRNLGIANVRCEYVAFLDSDDYYLPGRFARASEILTSSPGVDSVYEAVGTELANAAAEQWWHQRQGGRELTTLSEAVEPERLFECLVSGDKGRISTNGIVVRRRFLVSMPPFDPDPRTGEDSLMWRMMAAAGALRGGRLDEAVAIRRVHGENTIIKSEGDFLPNQRNMTYRLLRWAIDQQLSESRLNLALEKLLKNGRRHIVATTPRGLRKVRTAWFLVDIARLYPGAWQHSNYRHRWKQLFGYDIFKRFVGGKAGRA